VVIVFFQKIKGKKGEKTLFHHDLWEGDMDRSLFRNPLRKKKKGGGGTEKTPY